LEGGGVARPTTALLLLGTVAQGVAQAGAGRMSTTCARGRGQTGVATAERSWRAPSSSTSLTKRAEKGTSVGCMPSTTRSRRQTSPRPHQRRGCQRRHRLVQDATSSMDKVWAAEGDWTGARPTLGPARADKANGRYPHARCVADYPRSDGHGAHQSRLDRPLGTNSHSTRAVRASG